MHASSCVCLHVRISLRLCATLHCEDTGLSSVPAEAEFVCFEMSIESLQTATPELV